MHEVLLELLVKENTRNFYKLREDTKFSAISRNQIKFQKINLSTYHKTNFFIYERINLPCVVIAQGQVLQSHVSHIKQSSTESSEIRVALWKFLKK